MIIDSSHIRSPSSQKGIGWLQRAIRKNPDIAESSICAGDVPERKASANIKSSPKVLHRSDFHWSVWKTTPTPQPQLPAVIPPEPRAKVPSRLNTARSVRSLDLPRTPSVKLDEEYVRSTSALGRPGMATPSEMKADARDPLAAAQVAPLEQSLQKLKV